VRVRAGFFLSPWTDLSLTGKSLQENAASEVLLPVERIRELRDMYLVGAGPADARCSPLFAAFPDCPPVCIHASGSEILRDDSQRMHDHLTAQGVEARLEIWPGLPHVWQMFDGWLPAARHSLKQISKFVTGSFSPCS
jgi:acetyl esterase/lipase